MYIADVGQDHWEEINIEPRGVGNRNYGWRSWEGKHTNEAALPVSVTDDDAGIGNVPAITPPVFDYPHAQGNACIIGGYVYRGGKIPTLRGYYVYADFSSGRIWALAWNGAGLCAAPIDLSAQFTVDGSITSFGEDSAGELYVLTTRGVYRIDAR